jgi:hypothetical protein
MLRVAVITPYYKEPLDILRQCHESVAQQSYPCLHVMVGDGAPVPELCNWSIDHIVLPKPHGDIGSTPRLVGSYHAIGLGIDAVAFLDADNWYRPDHVESLVRLSEATGASFLSSSRMLCRPDRSVIATCPNTDPTKFIDTSCMMFKRSAFPVLAQWVLMPPYAHVIGDRVMLHYVKAAGVQEAHSGQHSVFYRCGKEGIYRALGERMPPGVLPAPDYGSAHAIWISEGYPPLC